MAMKDLNNVTPPANDDKWRSEINWGNMPKHNTWYHFRLVGGVYSIRQHWIEFVNKEGQKKRFSLECRNWNVDTETTDLENDCLPCTLGYKGQVRYLINAIDRNAQSQMKAGVSPICGLDLPPTLVREIQSLDKLNVHNNVPVSVTHPELGCDIHLQLNDQSSMNKWLVQKGNCIPLTEEERTYELYPFDEIYKLPNPEKTRMDFERMGLIDGLSNGVNGGTPVTTVQVPSQLESAPAPSVTVPVVTPVAVAAPQPVQAQPVQPAPVAAPVDQPAPVATIPTTTPIAVNPPVNQVVTPPVAVTPIAVNPPTTTVPVNPPTTEAVATTTVETATAVAGRPDCYPDGTDPAKRYLGQLKCVSCPFKQPCIAASGG